MPPSLQLHLQRCQALQQLPGGSSPQSQLAQQTEHSVTTEAFDPQNLTELALLCLRHVWSLSPLFPLRFYLLA